MAVSIRPMSVDDFADVYRLGLSCFDVQDKPYNYWSIEEVAHHLQTYPELCYVAEENGRLVGFALGAAEFELIEDTGHMEWAAVAPEYRRQGLATQLLESLLRAYQEMGKAKVVADVSASNSATRSILGKLGFSEGMSITYFVKQLKSTRPKKRSNPKQNLPDSSCTQEGSFQVWRKQGHCPALGRRHVREAESRGWGRDFRS